MSDLKFKIAKNLKKNKFYVELLDEELTEGYEEVTRDDLTAVEWNEKNEFDSEEICYQIIAKLIKKGKKTEQSDTDKQKGA